MARGPVPFVHVQAYLSESYGACKQGLVRRTDGQERVM